jgi:hypothetical protein
MINAWTSAGGYGSALTILKASKPGRISKDWRDLE